MNFLFYSFQSLVHAFLKCVPLVKLHFCTLLLLFIIVIDNRLFWVKKINKWLR
ncbi:hypothetical protein HanXRQr2_Chr08g0342031 [Helianthus annuus]|uniref:Uncharacterized protein n=1 Tax=Helianthus annuus TaxID=4232 RepID=A0A9K3NCV0_HELAN|nr:hypothetical protein HanXRQr2_Chr08g0342031 [Helianthus annuus]